MTDVLSIKQIRQMNGLTQKEMASILGIQIASYQRKETNRVPWKLDEIVRLKKHFNVDIDKIKETQ